MVLRPHFLPFWSRRLAHAQARGRFNRRDLLLAKDTCRCLIAERAKQDRGRRRHALCFDEDGEIDYNYLNPWARDVFRDFPAAIERDDMAAALGMGRAVANAPSVWINPVGVPA